MPMPAVPGPGLVVVETELVLGSLEAVLDRPAGAFNADERVDRSSCRAPRGEVSEISIGDITPDQQAACPQTVVLLMTMAPANDTSSVRGRCRGNAGTMARVPHYEELHCVGCQECRARRQAVAPAPGGERMEVNLTFRHASSKGKVEARIAFHERRAQVSAAADFRGSSSPSQSQTGHSLRVTRGRICRARHRARWRGSNALAGANGD